MHHKASVSTSQRTKRGQRSGQHQKRHAMPKRVQHVQSSRSIHVRSTQSASFTSTGSSQHDLQTSSARHIHTLKSSVDQAYAAEKFRELAQYLPPADHPEFNIRRSWISHLLTYKYTVLADFVAQLGRSVHIVDIRNSDEIVGPVGYIRGANWFPKSETAKIISSFPKDSPIAVVCGNDQDSRDVVRALKQSGHHLAAILAGGMRSWKLMGFTTSRNPSILQRRCVPVSVLYAEEQEKLQPLEGNKQGKRQMTLQQIINHLGTSDNITRIKMAAIMVHSRIGCIDGRDDLAVVGAPGGDMGEFIVHLATAEQLLGRPLTSAQVNAIFQRRLEAFGRFYMHTDEMAAESVLHRLAQAGFDTTGPGGRSTDNSTTALQDGQKDLRLSPDISLNSVISRTPKARRAEVLEILAEPTSIGCGHLKFLLTDSELYRVRHDLVKASIQAFFSARLSQAPECDYVVLSGHHEECGVANVRMKKPIHSYTRIPLISPSIQNKQIFVNHGQIAQYLRHQQCEWMLEQTDIIPFSPTAAAAFPALVDLLAEHHAALSVERLAKNLPMYTLEFDDDRNSCLVHYNGIIGGANHEMTEKMMHSSDNDNHNHNHHHHHHHHHLEHNLHHDTAPALTPAFSDPEEEAPDPLLSRVTKDDLVYEVLEETILGSEALPKTHIIAPRGHSSHQARAPVYDVSPATIAGEPVKFSSPQSSPRTGHHRPGADGDHISLASAAVADQQGSQHDPATFIHHLEEEVHLHTQSVDLPESPTTIFAPLKTTATTSASVPPV